MGLFWKRKSKKAKEEEKEKEPRKWSDVSEEDKFLVHGGKIQCSFCSVPIADFIVTSNTISLQGKYYGTVADCDGKTNFDFQGVCSAYPSISKPPCKSVIQLGQWKKFSDTHINDDKALVVRSTIPCMISGQDLKIVNSGQIEVLTDVEPRVVKSPRITQLFWIDAETHKRLRKIKFDKKVKLCFITADYEVGETVKATVKRKSGEVFENDVEELTFSGIVDSDGIAISDQVFENAVKKEQQKA